MSAHRLLQRIAFANYCYRLAASFGVTEGRCGWIWWRALVIGRVRYRISGARVEASIKGPVQ